MSTWIPIVLGVLQNLPSLLKAFGVNVQKDGEELDMDDVMERIMPLVMMYLVSQRQDDSKDDSMLPMMLVFMMMSQQGTSGGLSLPTPPDTQGFEDFMKRLEQWQKQWENASQ